MPLDEDDDGGRWYVAWCECRVCPDKARHISVFPVEADDERLECPRCHAMSSEAVEWIGPGVEVRLPIPNYRELGMPRHDEGGRITGQR